MVSAVIPVKKLTLAKERLAAVLTEAERRRLVLAFLRFELDLLRRIARIGEVIVVTSDAEVCRVAGEFGARIIAERVCLGYSAAVNLAAEMLARDSREAMMVLPCDLPFMTEAEVEQLLAAHPHGNRAMTIVPDQMSLGTNALLCTPPTVMPFSFGPGSFRRHVRQAHERGIMVRIRKLAGIGLDIDTPMDLAALRSRDPAWLHRFAESGLEEALVRIGTSPEGEMR